MSLKVGDQAILVSRHTYSIMAPEVGTVTKVSPKGYVTVEVGGEVLKAFRPWGEGTYRRSLSRYASTADYLYPYTDAKWDQVKEEYQQRRKDQQEREEEKEQQKKQREEIRQGELAEVKRVWQAEGLSFNPLSMGHSPHEGVRFYFFRLPINPKYVDRKKGFEQAWVRVEDHIDYEGVKDGVTFSMASVNGTSCSFTTSSSSSLYKGNDEEALWEAIRTLYFSSWW